MRNNQITLNIIFTITILILRISFLCAQPTTLDDFESTDGWSFIKADGVNLSISSDVGLHGNAVKFDYDFTKGTGYGGIQKFFAIDLPENFEFTFYLKSESPSNNFEIKFLDSTGQNVWWVNNRNYDFPKDWKKIKIKKRHIHFAWGPTSDQSLKRIDRIEFTIASFVGGKGTIWLDDFKFEPLLPETNIYPQPIATAKSQSFDLIPGNIIDGSLNTYWKSVGVKNQTVTFDFKTKREFGGLKINWLKNYQAKSFEVLLSEDGLNWENVYEVKSNQSNLSFIKLTETESRFLRLNLIESNSDECFGIEEISFLDVKNSLTPNDFLIYAAKNSPKGFYPRYFLDEASFWTVVGVNNDVKEAMINEDGMVEVDKASFSIEPILKIDQQYFNWSNVNSSQSLEENYLPIPKVTWNCDEVNLETKIFANGEANKNSTLYLKYILTNNSSAAKSVSLFLLIRPFQVNPHYQFLNLAGGVGKIKSIKETDNKIYVDDKVIYPITKYDLFGAAAYDEGNIVDLISNEKLSQNKFINDKSNLANGSLSYNFELKPGAEKIIYLAVPFYNEESVLENLNAKVIEEKFQETKNFWKEKVDHIKFNLPKSADRIVNTYKSNLAYILINRDKVGVQPGSRSYERSWIRDGSLTSSALLKSGIVDEVKDFIEWYAAHQYKNGKVPCVVDSRGPDPVPEHDSHGQLIYLIKEYFNFTKDTTFLRSKNVNVLKAVEYIQSLIAERSTDHFKYSNDSVRAYYGLVTESISHEGYSAKPMHSYWDNFFTMKGLKDAAEIQRILGEKENYERIKKVRNTFKENLYNSLNLAMKVRGVDYIPGCVELGDFDATSTTIALTPCNEINNLPKPQVFNTFDKYYEFFEYRRDDKIEWTAYTPYENRLIGSFIQLDQPERAHELIKFFLNDQRPQGWNHWAEVVWKDYRAPKFIGDMPHTWVGSDFINAVRSMFVYENEYDSSLVLGAALYQSAEGGWIDSPDGMSVENLPTYYGEISYSIKKENDEYYFSIYGDVKLPKGGIKIKNFNASKLPAEVLVNGKAIKDFSEKEIAVKEFPAELVITYEN
ncbi:MAG: discoidin domain-containing protein [Ignavibacteriaceae bacterium]|nr:discoidin domain-containing protein [Ignavibacteriaceae bacterium]